MTNWSSVLWWTYILLLVLQCCHRAHYKWVLNCVATPEIIRGPWSHNCAWSLCGWHGCETWWSSVCHERPWPELRLSLNDAKGGTRERSHWPAIVFSGGCVPWTSDCCGDWLLLAADVTAGSLEMSKFSDSGLSILLSSIPFGLLESVNLSIWVFLDRFYMDFSGLSSSRSLTGSAHAHCYMGSVKKFAGWAWFLNGIRPNTLLYAKPVVTWNSKVYYGIWD